MTATKPEPAKAAVADPRHPPEEIAHEADKEKRAAARAKKQPMLREMLNAEVAVEAERAKPRDRYRVKCVVNERVNGKFAGTTKEAVVTAKNEADAWAVFCDQNKTWPSPKACERTIERV